MRGCRHARQRVLRAVDQDLPLEQRFLLDEHLARCPACAAFEARALVLEETLARQPDPPHERLDVERAVASIHGAIAARPPVSQAARPSMARVLRVAAAGVLVAALGLAVVVLRGPRSESEEPAAASGRPTTTRAHSLTSAAAPNVLSVDEVERRVRDNLLAALRGLASEDDVTAAAQRFDEGTTELRLWPVVRVAEQLLADDDPEAARAAARYLGVRGDRISVSKLRAALGRAEVAPALVLALGDLGTPAIPALRQAMDDPALTRSALCELRVIGGTGAAGAIADALLARLRAPERNRISRIDPYLQALAGTGASAVEVLFELCARDELDPREVLPWLDQVEGGGRALTRILRSGGGEHPTSLLIQATHRLQPHGALWWVEERCQEVRHRDAALACIAGWEGTAPLASLLRLDAAGRVADEDLRATFRSLATADAARVSEHARDLCAAGDVLATQRYLELLIASEHEAAAPALATLASSELLSDDARQWAALAVGELGRSEDALRLLGSLGRLGTDERRLRAACLITIHRLLGDAGTAEAMEGFSPWSSRRVHDALRAVTEDGLGAVGLNRVARALDGALSDEPKTWNPAL